MWLLVARPMNQRDSGNRSTTYRRSLPLWLWLLVGVAWAVTLVAVFTGHTEWGDHHYLLRDSGLPFFSALGFFLVSWQVMILAMMVPSLTPVLRQMTSGVPESTREPGAIAMFLAGYDLIWTAFGCVAFFGDALIHSLVKNWSWLGAHDTIIAMGVLALAGVYQFTPGKAHFLLACQAPSQRADMSPLDNVDTASRAGASAGRSHLGSCWALMLAMFGVGMGSLVWMAALTGVMVAEQLLQTRALAFRWPVGLIFCALAVLTVALPAQTPGHLGLAGLQPFW
jgi:predicted metal-binding membrane protein